MCRLTSNHVRIPSHTQLSGSYPLPGRQKTLYNPLLTLVCSGCSVAEWDCKHGVYRNALLHCT